MELAVQHMKMNEATTVIDYEAGEDPYQMIQVHDYKNVSFLRLNPTLRAATKKTIEVFAMAYPELLREKFFVNVPTIMTWMFAAMKVFLSKNTTRKFHPVSNAAYLAREFPVAADGEFPKTYGGKGPELQESAEKVKLVDDATPAAAVTAVPAPPTAAPTATAAETAEPAATEPADAPAPSAQPAETTEPKPTTEEPQPEGVETTKDATPQPAEVVAPTETSEPATTQTN